MPIAISNETNGYGFINCNIGDIRWNITNGRSGHNVECDINTANNSNPMCKTNARGVASCGD